MKLKVNIIFVQNILRTRTATESRESRLLNILCMYLFMFVVTLLHADYFLKIWTAKEELYQGLFVQTKRGFKKKIYPVTYFILGNRHNVLYSVIMHSLYFNWVLLTLITLYTYVIRSTNECTHYIIFSIENTSENVLQFILLF